MKKIILIYIITIIISAPAVISIEANQPPKVPKWEEYVPQKYQNPRTDFSKGNAIAELSVGILLTDLLITAPIGVPMICHSSTKLKNIGYAEKKEKFYSGLEEAEKITDPKEKQIYYEKLLKNCKFTEKKRQKQLKKLDKLEKKKNKQTDISNTQNNEKQNLEVNPK